MLIIDSQSVKNTDLARDCGYDGGKKISGIKRHIGVDTQGIPHTLAVSVANMGDREGALVMLEGYSDQLGSVEAVLVDSGYTGDDFANAVDWLIGARVEVAKRSELHRFKVIPKRWIVERTFGWFEKCRRLWKNCERKLHTSFQMLNLASLAILMKRL